MSMSLDVFSTTRSPCPAWVGRVLLWLILLLASPMTLAHVGSHADVPRLSETAGLESGAALWLSDERPACHHQDTEHLAPALLPRAERTEPGAGHYFPMANPVCQWSVVSVLPIARQSPRVARRPLYLLTQRLRP